MFRVTKVRFASAVAAGALILGAAGANAAAGANKTMPNGPTHIEDSHGSPTTVTGTSTGKKALTTKLSSTPDDPEDSMTSGQTTETDDAMETETGSATGSTDKEDMSGTTGSSESETMTTKPATPTSGTSGTPETDD